MWNRHATSCQIWVSCRCHIRTCALCFVACTLYTHGTLMSEFLASLQSMFSTPPCRICFHQECNQTKRARHVRWFTLCFSPHSFVQSLGGVLTPDMMRWRSAIIKWARYIRLIWKEGDKSLKKQCGRDTNRTKKDSNTISICSYTCYDVLLPCFTTVSKCIPLPSRFLPKRDQLLAHHRPQHKEQQAGVKGLIMLSGQVKRDNTQPQMRKRKLVLPTCFCAL